MPRHTKAGAKAVARARSARAKWSRVRFPDNRDPATLGNPVGSRSCWCGNEVHGWPGDTEGAPHPRTWPGKAEGAPYPVPAGYEKHAKARP